MGMAAGLSASFRSPIGTAILAIEVLYAEMEFEPGALLYTMLASIVAYALNGFFVGWEPLFRVPADFGQAPLDRSTTAGSSRSGVAAGLVATGFPMLFYRTRDAFRASGIHPMLRPAVGGLLTGMIALVLPQVLGGGYGWMQIAIDGDLAIGALAAC